MGTSACSPPVIPQTLPGIPVAQKQGPPGPAGHRGQSRKALPSPNDWLPKEGTEQPRSTNPPVVKEVVACCPCPPLPPPSTVFLTGRIAVHAEAVTPRSAHCLHGLRISLAAQPCLQQHQQYNNSNLRWSHSVLWATTPRVTTPEPLGAPVPCCRGEQCRVPEHQTDLEEAEGQGWGPGGIGLPEGWSKVRGLCGAQLSWGTNPER